MSLIYLEEELPEIEIRELLSVDDYVEGGSSKIGMNVHSFEDIFYQLTLLLGAIPNKIPIARKALGLAQLHKSIVEADIFPIPTNIVPVVSIARKSDSDEDFFERHTEANKIGNYLTRRDELHKIFLGYEATSQAPPVLNVHVPMKVRIADTEETTVLLPADKITPTVKKMLTKIGISPFSPHFYKLTLDDKIKSSETESEEIAVIEQMTIDETFKHEIPKYIASIIENKTDVSTLYDLWKDFMNRGIDIDTLHYDDIQRLVEKLKNTEPEIESLKYVGETTPHPPHLETYSIYGFYSAQKAIFDKNATELAKIKQTISSLYKKLTEEAPYIAPTSFITAEQISSAILKEELTLEEIRTRIMTRLQSEQRKLIEDTYANIDKWDLSTIAPSLETEVKLATDALAFNDEPNSEWMSISGEIQKIKKGEVITKEYAENYTYAVEKDFMLDIADPEEAPFGLQEEEEKALLTDLNDGIREIYSVVYEMFKELKTATALELDFTELTLIAKTTNIIRKTKESRLQERFPDISAMLNDIDLETFKNIPEDALRNKKAIQKDFEAIYVEYVNDINTLWLHLLAWWICELQESVLHNRLHFDSDNCTNTCLHLWKPLQGAPMHPSTTAEGGIQPYILCVIKMLIDVKGSHWNKYVSINRIESRLDAVYKEPAFIEKVRTLQELYKDYKKPLVSADLKKKGDEIVNTMNLIVTKQIKEDYLKAYMSFLKNLPSVLNKDAPPNRAHLGCCLQRITATSQDDWRKTYTNAAKLKKYYLKKRKTGGKRPILITFSRILPQKSTSTLIAVKQVIPKRPTWDVNPLLTAFTEKYPSLTTMDIIRAKITQEAGIMEKYMKPAKELMKYLTVTATTSRDLIDCIQKMKQVQYSTMMTDYKNSPAEYAFLKEQFANLYNLHKIVLDDSFVVTDERTLVYYNRILQYIAISQSYFPCTLSTTGTPITVNTRLKSDFVKKYIGNTITNINQWIVAKTFNTTVNYTEYITKMREQENITKLRRIDVLTEEERQLYVQAKKLGLLEGMQYTEARDYQEDFFEGEREDANDEYIDPQEDHDEDVNEEDID